VAACSLSTSDIPASVRAVCLYHAEREPTAQCGGARDFQKLRQSGGHALYAPGQDILSERFHTSEACRVTASGTVSAPSLSAWKQRPRLVKVMQVKMGAHQYDFRRSGLD